jgi:ABC-2 type transport system permease protein
MNIALLRSTLKANYKLWLIMLMVMLMYSTIIISMFDPASMAGWEAILEMMPQEILRAMGFEFVDPTFLGYMAGYYYGFIIIMFPLIYVSIMGQRSIAMYVDNGSMSFLLATPNSRKVIASTQGFYMLMSTVALLIIVALSIFIIGISAYPGDIDFVKFLMLNLNVIGLFVLISGISFLASCIFNETRSAAGFGAGIPIGFYVIHMLANAADDLSFFRFFTIFSLFDTDRILELDPLIYVQMITMYVFGIALYLIGIKIFVKKDLPI